ncbi:MAG TPA: redoxin family protein [Vicinamibacteria bacterium]|nr:redoxin family protein [Vicinamibacteria bacterium]
MTVNRRVLGLGLVLIVPLVVLLLLNLDRDPHLVASPLVGRPAPQFALPPLDGGAPIALSTLRGRPVVVNFWATWCVPCLQEHPVLVEAARTLGDRVQFLGVVYEDGEPEVRRFLARRGSAYPSLLDPESRTAIAFGVFGVPETFFVDGEGRIAAKHVGPLDAESLGAKLRQAGLRP